jgi:hypothetical protein
VTVSIASRRVAALTQVTQVPVANSATAPAVTSVQMTSPAASPITGTATSATFSVTTTESPASMTWLARGTPMGTCPPATSSCTGSANAWSFTWNLGTPVKDASGLCLPGSYAYDGVYDVGAQAQDANGQTAGPNTIDVTLNRCSALPPASMLATGRNGTTSLVDVEWDPSPESDVVGYRVYEGTTLTSRTPVCPAVVSGGQYLAATAPTACVDTSPLAYSNQNPAYYMVVAVDRDASGALREGATSYYNVNDGNRAPNAVTNLTATRSTSGVTLSFSLPNNLDQDSGDTIGTFRVYRKDGTVTGNPAVTDRITRINLADVCTGSTCTYLDTGAVGSTRTYWITSVDTHLAESSYTGPRSA